MTEPIVVAAIIAGVFTLSGSILAIIMTVLNRRDAAAQAAAHAAVVTGQNLLIERLQADQQRGDRVSEGLQTRVTTLERIDGEKDARIVVLTEWGRWSTESPPRTPPAWRREDES